MIRVLRMMRAMKYWPGLLRIFMCLLGAARQVTNISLDLPGLLRIFMCLLGAARQVANISLDLP
jgi:hypothetical protein